MRTEGQWAAQHNHRLHRYTQGCTKRGGGQQLGCVRREKNGGVLNYKYNVQCALHASGLLYTIIHCTGRLEGGGPRPAGVHEAHMCRGICVSGTLCKMQNVH